MAQQPHADKTNVKILSVVWYKVLPSKYGGQKAVTHFNEYLGQITPLECLCSKNNELEKSSYGIHAVLPLNKLQFVNPITWRKIYLFAKKNHITHLILEFPYHGIAGILCKKFLGIKLIINTHNIEYLRFRQLNKWWWCLLFYFERWVLRNADAVFFKTKNDKTTAQNELDLDPQRLAVLPYGVEKPAAFSKQAALSVISQNHSVTQEDRIILFAGTLDYQPNADAVFAIKNYIIPLLNKHSIPFKIIVCGRNQLAQFSYLNKIEDARLIMAGDVEDIDPYFQAADVFINPVLGGGGIQTKILHALSFHLNVVCFESKAACIDHAAEKIFAAKDNDWNAFAGALKKALGKVEETPAAFFENYNWRTIAAKARHQIIAIG